MQHLWLGRNIKAAIDEKRVHHQLLPMEVVHDIGLKKVKSIFTIFVVEVSTLNPIKFCRMSYLT